MDKVITNLSNLDDTCWTHSELFGHLGDSEYEIHVGVFVCEDECPG